MRGRHRPSLNRVTEGGGRGPPRFGGQAMRIRWGWRTGLLLAVLVALTMTWTVARGQAFLSAIGAPPLPALPPTGAWGVVIMANTKWIVVQNSDRQQFPIKVDSAHIRQFLVRWKTSPAALTPNSLVEAI